jgi:hypothetical protein
MSATVLQTSETNRFAKSLTGSIKSLLNTGGRTYFMLEHKTKSEKHKAGETREFIGDYIELGRGDSYAVNFGNDCTTVSRPHAAIVRKDNGWIIRPLSQTNPTLVNNKPVTKEWHLTNGDEIQLSARGPIMSFLIPANNKTGTMGFTIRMRAVVNEAIKPYKAIISIIVALFLLVVSGSVYYFNNYKKKQEAEISGLMNTINILKNTTPKQLKQPDIPAAPPRLRPLFNDVYFIESNKIIISYEGKVDTIPYGISGTGFLLNNGKFVTARHMVQPWLFPSDASDSTSIALNMLATKGADITFYFSAFSPGGKRLNFTNKDFTVDNSSDEKKSLKLDSTSVTITLPSASSADWAETQTDTHGDLVAGNDLSKSLSAGTSITILGYPMGKGVVNTDDIKPWTSQCEVARDGLENGLIDISGRSFTHGNSGGPVFVIKNGRYMVVGLVSSHEDTNGYIVPVCNIK